MNSNSTENSLPFGHLNWNISQEVSRTLENVTNNFNIIGVVVEITVIIFFIANFFKKNSTFRQPYFIIYTMGCIVDAVPKSNLFFNQYIYRNAVYTYVAYFINWYNANFVTLCNLILALNRFSAIVFPLYFSRIWTKRKTAVICVFLAAYPFLIHSFNPLYMFYTFTRFNGPTANVKQTDFEQVFSYASDISYAVLATIAGTVAAMQMMVQNKMKNKKVERVLLAQSLTSSVFLIFSTASSWLASVNMYNSSITFMPEIMRRAMLQLFFLNVSKLFYSLHHYTGLVLLITMSRNFRDKFCDFYHISFLLKRFRRIYKNEASLTVTVLSTTATSKKSNLFRNFSA